MSTEEALRTAASEVEAAVARRDDLIRDLRAEGASLRCIAEAAGVSHQTVANVLRR